jgi:DNA-binding LacI/PurR family transcriptional regulator
MISIRPDSETVDLYRKRAVPVVLIDEKAPGVASVACDNFSGGYLAGRHLLEKGHHRIALVSGRVLGPGSWNAAQRRDGLRKALSEVAGYPVIQCEAPNYSEQDGAEALHSVVRSEATAVFCAAGDVVAGAMLRIAPDAGISVPKDLAVIGFDDLGTADLIGLTTVRQPLQALSEAAYRMTCINPVETMERPRQIVFPPEIVQRRTT